MSITLALLAPSTKDAQLGSHWILRTASQSRTIVDALRSFDYILISYLFHFNWSRVLLGATRKRRDTHSTHFLTIANTGAIIAMNLLLRQIWALVRKNLLLICVRRPISTFIRAFALPLVVVLVLAYSKNFFSSPQHWGVTSPHNVSNVFIVESAGEKLNIVSQM
jgi:hypothetical protein